METPKTITITRQDAVTLIVTYEPVTINVEDYPELNGMSHDEIQDYIKDNAYSMKGMDADNLGEDIEYSNVQSEVTDSENVEWIFD